ncbi:MAG: site-2 protease family protein [Woronichinia naegeliana WA131]|uniref:Zinc metalloprotease n=1 Tax=Woronichinia naegeliana WA131 TaxID=2824559 RepID=A0A977KYC0_9CYAN|nr:MAG: site-2 protease family protein [Woronichinia naegeliana WA131]
MGLVSLANATEINQQILGNNQVWLGGVLGLLLALLLFASVLLHELGHSLAARTQGITVNSITLFLFGGVAAIERESKTPLGAFWVAIAGPLVSFALFIIFWTMGNLGQQWLIVRYFGQNLGQINLFLGLFNLIPGLPLDGGQILKALVWKLSGDRLVGVRWAARSGQGIGLIGVALGLISLFVIGDAGGAWLALVGWFVWRNANAYERTSNLQSGLKMIRATEVMTREFRVVNANLTLREFAETYLLQGNQNPIPYYAASDGRYRGLVRVNLLQDIERSEWDWLTLQDIAIPLTESPHVGENSNLVEIINQLERSGDRSLTVLSPASAVAGVIDRGDVVKAIVTQQGLPIPEAEIKRIKQEAVYPSYLPLVNLAKSLEN